MRVGDDIGALCRKCGDVWHVVVALVDGRIAKVECKQCGARHRYRPVDGATGPGARRTRSAAAPRKRSREKKPIVEADRSRPRRSFDASETYAVGDRIVHPSFGEGVVREELMAPLRLLARLEVRETETEPTVCALRFSVRQDADGAFRPIDSGVFTPAAEIAIDLAAPGGRPTRMFSGYVTHIRPHFEALLPKE